MQHPKEETSRQVTIPRVNNRPVATKRSSYDESQGFTKTVACPASQDSLKRSPSRYLKRDLPGYDIL
jgi:hypothetical protein